MTATDIKYWLVCPECGSDDVEKPFPPKDGHNSYFECRDCGHQGVFAA